MSRDEAVLAMYVAEQYSFPARYEFELQDLSTLIASMTWLSRKRAELDYERVASLEKRNLVAQTCDGRFALTERGRRLGEQLLKQHPRRREALSEGRFRIKGMPSFLERFLRLSELLTLDAAQGRRSQWLAHGFATTDVDWINPDPAAQRQESAVLFRLEPLWDGLERRWRRLWRMLFLFMFGAEIGVIVLALTGFDLWWVVLMIIVYLRTMSLFRGSRYMARLVHILNPGFTNPLVHEEGYEPSSAFGLYLREFRTERNQGLNALNGRWGIDPYEHRIRKVLKTRSLNLLGLVDPSRREPSLFLEEAEAVTDDRWQAEVRRLVPAAAVVIVDLRQPSSGGTFDVSTSVKTELDIIRTMGADRRTIGFGQGRFVFLSGGMMWHIQPQSLAVVDIGLGFLVGVAAYLLPFAGGSWVIAYVAGRLHIASGAVLVAWRHRFQSQVDRVLGQAPRGVRTPTRG